MAITLEQFGLDKLPADERRELLGLLWDSLGGDVGSPPEWHLRVLEQRRAQAEADPAAGISWADFKAGWSGRS